MAENIESRTSSVVSTPPAPSPQRHFAIGSLIIVPSLLLAVTFGQQASSTTATPAAAAAPAPEAPADPAPAGATAAAVVPESKTLKSELEDLSAQLKNLHRQVDGLPKPEPALDLKPIENKIDELSKSITAAKPLLEKVDKLVGRAGDFGKRIESLQSEVVALMPHKSGK